MAKAEPAAVGGFVLGALALAVTAVLFFGGSRLFAHTIRAVVFFEGSVAGLDIGAPVTFRGVRVGSVQHIELQIQPSGQARIPVTLEIFPELVAVNGKTLSATTLTTDQLINAGLRAQLNLQSIVTGQLRVDLDFRPDTPVHLESVDAGELPQIPALPSDLERLRESLAELPIRELSQNLLHVLESVQRLADHMDTQMGSMVDSARQGFDAATRTLETTQAAIGQLQSEASHTLADADKLIGDTRQRIDDRSAEIASLLRSADRVSRQAESLLASVNSLTDQRSEFRGNLEASVRDLAATTASLRGLSRDLERDPSVVVRGRGGH